MKEFAVSGGGKTSSIFASNVHVFVLIIIFLGEEEKGKGVETSTRWKI